MWWSNGALPLLLCQVQSCECLGQSNFSRSNLYHIVTFKETLKTKRWFVLLSPVTVISKVWTVTLPARLDGHVLCEEQAYRM